jgi:hypothetical protein
MEELEAKLAKQKTFLNMVIHEIKHPIEALEFLHGNQKQNQGRVLDDLIDIESNLTELAELDLEEPCILPIGV